MRCLCSTHCCSVCVKNWLTSDHRERASLILAMASLIAKRVSRSSAIKSIAAALEIKASSRSYAKVAVGTDIVSAAPNVSLQKARTWDEGVSSQFSTTPLKDIFKVSAFSSTPLYFCQFLFSIIDSFFKNVLV